MYAILEGMPYISEKDFYGLFKDRYVYCTDVVMEPLGRFKCIPRVLSDEPCENSARYGGTLDYDALGDNTSYLYIVPAFDCTPEHISLGEAIGNLKDYLNARGAKGWKITEA